MARITMTISKNIFLSLIQDQQSCDITWRYARSCFDIATLKGKDGDFEGKRTLLYEGKLHCFFFFTQVLLHT